VVNVDEFSSNREVQLKLSPLLAVEFASISGERKHWWNPKIRVTDSILFKWNVL